MRVLLIGAAGLGLGLLRVGWAEVPVPASVWPILGAMFMFRLMVYLYDIRNDPTLGSFWARLSYFFLLPNVCFPLFPVVDYKTYCKNYYNEDRRRIYQGGLQWIYRGVLQLILYRLVYQTLVLDPADVADVATLGHYLIWPFLLYLRVSGQFHIIVGMLRLFGFNLPETHHEYFLASSFTDFWRRINIYWKDFMMKLFYYPAFFALRKSGPTRALVLATVLVFAVTWFFHGYQTFWLQGAFHFTPNDGLFWAVLGVLVVVNALWEVNHGRARALTQRSQPWGATFRLAAKTVGMYCGISVLWSLWSTESLTTWLSLWSAAGRWPERVTWPTLACLAVPVVIGVVVIAKARAWVPRPSLSLEARGVLVAVGAACLVVLTSHRVSAELGAAGETLVALRSAGLNQADAVAMERGYYENLMAVDRFNGELWALYMNRPLDWGGGLLEEGLARPTDTFVPYELLPSAQGRFKGVTLRTNSWGMHDKEYSKAPPPGCHRIAVLGASHAMGSGVERDRTFGAVFEDRLNRERPGRCYEILNFAVYGYNPLVQSGVLESRVLEFQPKTILHVGHPEDSERVARYLAQGVRAGTPLPDEYLRQIVGEAAVTSEMPERVVTQRLMPFGERLLSGLYNRIIGITRSRGICAGFVYMPMVPDMKYGVDVEREKRLALDAGYVVLDLFGAYDVPDREALFVATWDAHPNAEGHRLVAEKLHRLALQNEQALFGCSAR